MKTFTLKVSALSEIHEDWKLFPIAPHEFISIVEVEEFEKMLEFGKKYKLTIEEIS